MARKNIPAAEVRAWAKDNIDSIPEEGHKCLGEGARGRLHPAVTEAFRKAHKGKQYTPKVAEKRTIEVPVVKVDKLGRKSTRKVTVTTEEARAALGHQPGRRGRFKMEALSKALSEA
jgi:hypothetical protein